MFSSMKLFIKQIVSEFSFLAMNMTLAVEMALNIHYSLTIMVSIKLHSFGMMHECQHGDSDFQGNHSCIGMSPMGMIIDKLGGP